MCTYVRFPSLVLCGCLLRIRHFLPFFIYCKPNVHANPLCMYVCRLMSTHGNTAAIASEPDAAVFAATLDCAYICFMFSCCLDAASVIACMLMFWRAWLAVVSYGFSSGRPTAWEESLAALYDLSKEVMSGLLPVSYVGPFLSMMQASAKHLLSHDAKDVRLQ